MTAVATAERVEDGPAWARPFLLMSGGVVALAAVLAAARLPAPDLTVWLEAVALAGSTVLLIAVAWWLTGRPGVVDRRIVLAWGLGSGAILGALWLAEIAFNNLTPHSVSTAAARGVLDNTTWAIVGLVTLAAAARVTARTGRWRSGVRAGAWSGAGSGLAAAVGGALLVGLLRPHVERDPLMLAEWRSQGSGTGLAAYVARETMAGVFGHLWALGVVQGALLGLIAASVTAAVARSRRPGGRPVAAGDAE